MSTRMAYMCTFHKQQLMLILGPVIFRFKKSEIPFRFRFIIGNVEFDEITIYWKKVRWTDRTVKMAQLVRWTEEKGHN